MSGAATPDRADAVPRGLIARLHWRLMPFLLLMYVMAFLDRTNVGFAQQAFQADTGVGDAAYAFGASIFFVGYALLEVPSNLLLVRFGARRWMARIMVTWGLVAAATMFATGEASFHLLRALLGIAEAGFFPGIVYYLVRFYPPADRARAMGLFYFGAPISFIVGGPVSGLLLSLDGAAGLRGWQWLFLVEGLAASVVGVIAFFYLSDGPEDARWLTADEKARLRRALAGAGDGGPHAHAPLGFVRQPRVLLLAAIYALIQMTVYALVFSLPQQVATLLGRKVGIEVGFVSAIPWLAALGAAWLVPRLARGREGPLAAAMLVLAALGIAGSVLAASPVAGLAALAIAAAGAIAVQPLFWSIAAATLALRHAAGGIAFLNAIGAVGAFAAPNLRARIDLAIAQPGSGLAAIALLALAGAALLLAAGRGGTRA